MAQIETKNCSKTAIWSKNCSKTVKIENVTVSHSLKGQLFGPEYMSKTRVTACFLAFFQQAWRDRANGLIYSGMYSGAVFHTWRMYFLQSKGADTRNHTICEYLSLPKCWHPYLYIGISVFVLVDVSIRSHRKLLAFITKNYACWTKVSKKCFIWFWKQNHWLACPVLERSIPQGGTKTASMWRTCQIL